MFIFRLENENGEGPFSASCYDYDKPNIREMLIPHLVPTEQYLSLEQQRHVCEELLDSRNYHFAWSTPELMFKFIKPGYMDQVKDTGYKVVVYEVPNEHTYILPRDGQVIFNREYQRFVGAYEYHDFCLNVDWNQWK